MANNITIGCLGPRPLAIDASVPDGEAVDRMIRHWQAQLDRVLPDRPDVVVLHEACDRPDPGGFPLERRLAYYRYRGSLIREFLMEAAARHRCYITYPAHTEAEDGSWRNSMQLIDRDGAVMGRYHKNYLVPDEYDKNGILYGKDAAVFDCDFGKVGAAVCFDLNFEALRLQYAEAGVNLILFPSMYHGGLMQNYWAYSCRAYFAGAVSGAPCTVVTPLGEVAAHSTNYQAYVSATVNLDYLVLHLDENGERFPEIKRKYGPKIKIHDPGFLGSVLLTSETEEVTAREIAEEFGLEPLDAYFSRAAACRRLPGRLEP